MVYLVRDQVADMVLTFMCFQEGHTRDQSDNTYGFVGPAARPHKFAVNIRLNGVSRTLAKVVNPASMTT